MEQNESITARFLEDADFRTAVSRYLMTQVDEQIRGETLAIWRSGRPLEHPRRRSSG